MVRRTLAFASRLKILQLYTSRTYCHTIIPQSHSTKYTYTRLLQCVKYWLAYLDKAYSARVHGWSIWALLAMLALLGLFTILHTILTYWLQTQQTFVIIRYATRQSFGDASKPSVKVNSNSSSSITPSPAILNTAEQSRQLLQITKLTENSMPEFAFVPSTLVT